MNLSYTSTLVRTTCWCGVPLAIPESLDNEARTNGRAVYCPLGHTFVYGNTTKKQLSEAEERLRRERQRREATLNLLAAEERSHAATKGHLTRQKKRHAAGVCPCCNRTFQQLAQHMQSKHPGYQA